MRVASLGELQESQSYDKGSRNIPHRYPTLAVLFLNNDLRIADTHQAVDQCVRTFQNMGFETASLNQGYGRALDFVFEGGIESLQAINTPFNDY